MLEHATEVHDDHAVAQVLDGRQVVGDEQAGEPQLLLQVAQQVEDRGLDRDVERGDRLVGHEQAGAQRERAGQPDALALAAGQLVGQPVAQLVAQADAIEQLRGAPVSVRARGLTVQHERLDHRVAHRAPRAQR